MTVPYAFASATTSIPLSELDANFNTPITLGNTAIQLGNTVTTLNNMTLANATVSSGNVTITSANLSGNLNFTGTGNRITGDFSNATLANRVTFQTNTVNGATNVGLIPNGTSTTSRFNVFNTTDTTNYSVGALLATSSEVRVTSDAAGSGTQLPMTFYTNGSEAIRIATSGNVGIGTASPQELLELSASNNGITAGTAPNNTLRFNDVDISTASGQPIGRLEFYGNDTGNENVVAYIDARASGTSGGGFFVFGTSASGGGVATDVFTMSVTGGIVISRTDVTAPVSNDGNVFSGTYTPTLTNVSNVAASTAYQCQYMRVGNVVTVSGRVNIDATTTSTNTTLGVSLPIASNFASAQNAGGSFAPSAAALSASGVVFADTTNDRASFRILIDSAAANDYYFMFTYLVI